MAALHTPWQKIQHYFWLVCGICCLFAALVFWAVTDSDDVIEIEKSLKLKFSCRFNQKKSPQ